MPKRAWHALLIALPLLAAVATLGGVVSQSSAATTTTPVRAAFYYPWFAQTWHDDDHFHPTLGKYSNDDPDVLRQHFAAMRYAGLDAAISSWWGPGTVTDRRLAPVMDAAAAQGMTVAPYYEKEYGDADPTAAEVKADLDHLKPLTARSSWLKVDGKPVIFVYNAGRTGCADVAKWKSATNGFTDYYVQMKVFSGFASCPDQPSSWHQYGPASNRSVHKPYAYNVSPGFWHHGEATPRLARDLKRFETDLRDQVASGVQWQLVTSFSEWGEGTAVESASEWASASGYGQYLDTMRKVYVGGDTPTATPTSSTLKAAADAYVAADLPSKNYGSSTSLRVDGDPVRRGYVKFQVPAAPVKATLRVWSATGSSSGFEVASTGNSWSESSLTYANAPAAGTIRGQSGKVTSGTWLSFDVTGAVTKAGDVSFVIRKSSSTSMSLGTKEGGNPAQLVVTTGTAPTPTSTPSTPSTGSTVVWAAGDNCDARATARCADVGRLIAGDPDTDAVIALGDLQYEVGDYAEFMAYYDRFMGSAVGLKARTMPVVGNHEYKTTGAPGYFDYWGSLAGARDKGYYAKDLGTWRVVVANTNCSNAGGCTSTSPQGQWLQQQLATAPACTIVAGHHPALTDGNYYPGTTAGGQVFSAAYAGGAELYLSGHDHQYQRFSPRNGALAPDAARGVRQFVVGTGGRGLYPFGSAAAQAEYRQNTKHGALRLVLGDGRYTWQFVAVDGSVLDSGSGTCH